MISIEQEANQLTISLLFGYEQVAKRSAPVSVAVDFTDVWKNVLLPACCVPAGSEKLPAFLFRGFADTEYR